MFRRNGMGTFSALTAVGLGIGIGMAASRMMKGRGIQLGDMMMSSHQQHGSQYKHSSHQQ